VSIVLIGQDLRMALDQCYKVFSVYARPSFLEAAPTRDPIELLRNLIATSLRELPAENLGPYAGYAMTTVGSADDYLYFLPRILELAILEGSYTGFTFDVIASKLVYNAGWSLCSKQEQEAVVNVMQAVVRQCLDTKTGIAGTISLSNLIVGLGILGEPIEDILKRIRDASDSEAGAQLFLEFAMELPSEVQGDLEYTKTIPQKLLQVLLRFIFANETRSTLVRLSKSIDIDQQYLIGLAIERRDELRDFLSQRPEFSQQ
jgi:hypothetical protein